MGDFKNNFKEFVALKSDRRNTSCVQTDVAHELSETVLGHLVNAVCRMSKESKRCTIATTK